MIMKIFRKFAYRNLNYRRKMNKKKLLTICMFIVTAGALQAQSFETATQAVKNMGVGWNLGNTLDANNNNGSRQDLTSEICWGQPYTKPELMKMMKEAGFGAIRVPVTWFPHMDTSNKVDAAWMKRVHEVVDYVLDNGMYCILNVHHDTGDGNSHWLHASTKTYNNVKGKYEALWQQIAEEFKDYGEKLLFEAYNEMLDDDNCWNYPSWYSNKAYNATSAKDSYDAINKYAQSFVDVVRATGGNNTKRNLVVNTYAAACGGEWGNGHPNETLTELVIPTDTKAGNGHIAVEVHTYPSVTNITNAKNEVNALFSRLKSKLTDAKGVPVIIGEWGTANSGETDYDVRHDNVIEFADYFVKKAKEYNCATFHWMGLTDGTNRSLPVFNQADLAETIVKAYYGNTEGNKYPTRDDITSEYEVTYNNQWSELNLIQGTISTSTYKGLELELAETPAAKAFQFKVYPSEKTQEITAAKSTLTFTSAMGTSISRITMQSSQAGNKTTVKNVYLIKKDGTKQKTEVSAFWGCSVTEKVITGIKSVIYTPVPDHHIYNLRGQRVTNPVKGIYIQNGKKYFSKKRA